MRGSTTSFAAEPPATRAPPALASREIASQRLDHALTNGQDRLVGLLSATWTGSRRSTTGSATRRATSCSSRWPVGCEQGLRRATCWPGSAATSSWWCSARSTVWATSHCRRPAPGGVVGSSRSYSARSGSSSRQASAGCSVRGVDHRQCDAARRRRRHVRGEVAGSGRDRGVLRRASHRLLDRLSPPLGTAPGAGPASVRGVIPTVRRPPDRTTERLRGAAALDPSRSGGRSPGRVHSAAEETGEIVERMAIWMSTAGLQLATGATNFPRQRTTCGSIRWTVRRPAVAGRLRRPGARSDPAGQGRRMNVPARGDRTQPRGRRHHRATLSLTQARRLRLRPRRLRQLVSIPHTSSSPASA